jgi:hypothetical protein
MLGTDAAVERCMAGNVDSLLLAVFYAAMAAWIGSKAYQRRRERSWTTWALRVAGIVCVVLMSLALRAFLHS